MTHLSDGQIAAHLDGELADERARRVGEHLRECGRCARRRDELAEISGRLDATLERGLEPPADIEPTAEEPGRWRRFGGLKAAAAVVALVGAGALAADAALPGSPLQDLVVRAADALPGVDRPTPTVEPPDDAADRTGATDATVDSATGEASRPARRGLAVSPVDGRLLLRISGASDGTAVHVDLTGDARGRISARGGTFRTDPGRLEILDPAPGPIRVSVPREGQWRIEVGSRTVLRRTDGRVVRDDGSVVEGRSSFSFRVGGRPDGDG